MRALLLVMCIALATADVRLPPKITKHPESRVYESSALDMEMHCEADGIPEVEYFWKKNDEDFDLNKEHIKNQPGVGTFTFKVVTALDEGYYQCFAKNQYGLAMSHVSAILQAMLRSFPTVSDPKKYEAETGNSLMVECNAPYSYPIPQISWVIANSEGALDPKDITISKRISIDLNGNLNYANVVPSDEMDKKIHKCKVYNPQLRTTKEGSESKIVVKSGTAVPSLPVIRFKPEKKEIVVAGTTVEFQCLFGGYPTPEVNFIDIDEGGLTGRKTSRQFGTVMQIADVIESDSGMYRCTGKNSQGENPYEFEIDVNVIPEFVNDTAQPHNMNKTNGDKASFTCATKAKPDATVQWFKNGVTIDSANPGPKMQVTDDGRTLTIIDLCKTCGNGQTDLMVIQCNASNEHGYAFAEGYLNVLLKTKLIKEPRDVNLLDWKDEVKFDCLAEGDQSTVITTTWYFKGVEIDPNNEAYTILDDGLIVDAVLLDNEEKGKAAGEYKCTANNGYSQVSKTASLTLPTGTAPVIDKGGVNWVLIVVIILVVILLIILIILIYCVCKRRGMQDEYLVDEKEKKAGLDPEKELLDNGFHGYERPEARGFKGSQASLASHVSNDSAFMTNPRGGDSYA